MKPMQGQVVCRQVKWYACIEANADDRLLLINAVQERV